MCVWERVCVSVCVGEFVKEYAPLHREVEVTRLLAASSPHIIKVLGSSVSGEADIVHNTTSEVIIVFPLYQV